MSRTIITNICFTDRTKKNMSAITNKLKSENHIFTLENIILIPKELRGFPVDTISYQQYALISHERGDSSLFDSKVHPDNLEALINNIKGRRPENNCGEVMYQNNLKYGAPSWREFTKNEWGMGENCNYSTTMLNTNTIALTTLVKSPFPIFKKLSEMFPYDHIHVKYASDNPGEYVGSYILLNGEVIEKIKINDKRLVYCELFKKDKHMFQDIYRMDMINLITGYEKTS